MNDKDSRDDGPKRKLSLAKQTLLWLSAHCPWPVSHIIGTSAEAQCAPKRSVVCPPPQ
jgi:hypothetical protein